MTEDELLRLIEMAANEAQTDLDFPGENLRNLPPEIGNLTGLQSLDLCNNQQPVEQPTPEFGMLRASDRSTSRATSLAACPLKSPSSEHWEEEIKNLADALKTVSPANLQGFREDIDLYTEIRQLLPNLTNLLKDMNTLTLQAHKESGFAVLFKAVEQKLSG